MKLIKILSEWKPEGVFRVLAAVMLSFSMALIVAGGMVLAGCESPAGIGKGYDEATSGSAGVPLLAGAAGTKTIEVKFEFWRVCEGWRIYPSEGIVGTQNNRYLIYGNGKDYTITITAPAGDEYLNVYWRAYRMDFPKSTPCVQAKMKAESGTITLIMRGSNMPEVWGESGNLYDVKCFWDPHGLDRYEAEWWEELKVRTGIKEVAIKVKFDVKNGGYGLLNSYGMVSTEDDDYLVYDGASFADDYTVAITVPLTDEYLNIRWKGTDIWHRDTYVKAKMKPESGTITLDYNGHNKVATKNLYDAGSSDAWEWEDAKKRAGK